MEIIVILIIEDGYFIVYLLHKISIIYNLLNIILESILAKW